MSKASFTIASLLAVITLQSAALPANEPTEQAKVEKVRPFTSFTGRVTRNKVRMRLQPNIDCPIICELNRDHMLIVVDEDEDFFMVEPPSGTKAYIYRTYILDGLIEGNRVNVRLEPTIESPVIAQMHTGDKIEGEISSLNSKWMEIKPPATTRFYICKDYLEKIGDPQMMARIEERRLEVNGLLNATYLLSQAELDKPFEYVQLDKAYEGFSRIIDEYHDFSEQVSRAKELLAETQENYLQKKIQYLEEKTHSVTAQLNHQNQNSSSYEPTQQQQLGLASDSEPRTADTPGAFKWKESHTTLEGAMAAWVPTEETLYEQWTTEHSGTKAMFYDDQLNDAVTLRGVVQGYNRLIKNKPGDFVLMSQATRNPIAYLYSTKINLRALEGNVVTIKVSPRDNHNFAFPAYFVIEAE